LVVQLTITTRCYPCRTLECTAKLFASACVQRQLGFTLAAANSAAKLTPPIQPNETGSVLPLPSLCIEPWSFHPDSIHPRLTRFYPRRLFELTREVFPGSPQPISQPGPATRNGLSLACNGSRFHEPHSRVDGPGLLLRSLAASFAARSTRLLHCRFRFAPVSAASSLLARCRSACR